MEPSPNPARCQPNADDLDNDLILRQYASGLQSQEVRGMQSLQVEDPSSEARHAAIQGSCSRPGPGA